MSDTPRFRGDFWNEQAKHRNFHALIELVDNDPRANAIYDQSGLVRSVHSGCRVLTIKETGATAWSEFSRYCVNAIAYETLRLTYQALHHPERHSTK